VAFDAALQSFVQLIKQWGPALDAGLLIFARTLAFLLFGSVFNRKDVVFNIKLAFALFLTVSLLWVVPINRPTDLAFGLTGPFLILLGVNVTIGMALGFIGDILLKTISAAGSMMNNQIGLSSAMVFDPSSRTQVMIIDQLFSFIGLLLFIHLGGFFWLIQGLQRSFEVFPLYEMLPKFTTEIDLDYLTLLSANVITVATQLVAPIIVVTMAIDVILGIVNRTAQQMPVFQMSFALKPCVGVGVLLATLPIMIQSMVNFLNDFAQLY